MKSQKDLINWKGSFKTFKLKSQTQVGCVTNSKRFLISKQQSKIYFNTMIQESLKIKMIPAQDIL